MLPQPAARGRRAAARPRQAAGRLPARAHARPAGHERVRAASRTSWRAPTPELGATLDALVEGGEARSDDHRAGRRRAGRGRRARSATTRNPDVAVVRPARGRRAGHAAGRGAGAGRRAPRWSSSTTRPRRSGWRRPSTAARAPTCRAPQLELLGRVAAAAAARRHGEAAGRADRRGAGQARHPDQRGSQPARRRPSATSTCSLIADATTPRAARRGRPDRARGAGGRRRGGRADRAARGAAPRRLPGHHRGVAPRRRSTSCTSGASTWC